MPCWAAEEEQSSFRPNSCSWHQEYYTVVHRPTCSHSRTRREFPQSPPSYWSPGWLMSPPKFLANTLGSCYCCFGCLVFLFRNSESKDGGAISDASVGTCRLTMLGWDTTRSQFHSRRCILGAPCLNKTGGNYSLN